MILRAAGARFAAHGVHGTTMREIAAASGLNLPSIYHFFNSKDALYRLCIQLSFKRAAPPLEALLVPLQRGLTEARDLVAFVEGLCDCLAEDVQLRSFLLQRHQNGDSWVDGTPLQPAIASFVSVLHPGKKVAAESAAQVGDRLLGLAIGDALAREAFARRRGGGTGLRLPPFDPAQLLELALPGWRSGAS